jgi:hypothetical protein
VVAQHRIHRRAHAYAHERASGAGQQPRILWSVEVGSVVERIRIARQLDAVIAVGADEPASERGQRPRELVALIVVDQIAALDDGIRADRSDRAGRARQHLRRERLLGAEGRLERRAEPV